MYALPFTCRQYATQLHDSLLVELAVEIADSNGQTVLLLHLQGRLLQIIHATLLNEPLKLAPILFEPLLLVHTIVDHDGRFIWL